MTKLINVHNFHSNKQNKDYSVIQVLRDITQRERDNGYIGDVILEEIFLPDNLVNVLGLSDINQELDLQYSVIGGKAILDNIVVLKK